MVVTAIAQRLEDGGRTDQPTMLRVAAAASNCNPLREPPITVIRVSRRVKERFRWKGKRIPRSRLRKMCSEALSQLVT